MPRHKKIKLNGIPKPRHVGEKQLSVILSGMTSERNELRIVKIRSFLPLVMRPFFRDYITGIINMAIDKSEVIHTTKKNLGSIHVLQFPSKNSAEWDRQNGLTDCSIILTHKYEQAKVIFDDGFRQQALKRLKNGQEYLKKAYGWLG